MVLVDFRIAYPSAIGEGALAPASERDDRDGADADYRPGGIVLTVL